MTFPNKISIPSDDTQLELVSVDTAPKTKEQIVTYKYIKAKYLLDSVIRWYESDFKTLVRKEIIVF